MIAFKHLLFNFPSFLAHELQTTVNNLRNNRNRTFKKQCSDEYRSLLEKYINEYECLSKLIENLLFLARSDHGQLKLQKEMINIKKEISNICDYYQAYCL